MRPLFKWVRILKDYEVPLGDGHPVPYRAGEERELRGWFADALVALGTAHIASVGRQYLRQGRIGLK